MAAAVPPPRVCKKPGHALVFADFFGVQPIHPAAALDSKGMDAAIARGPR